MEWNGDKQWWLGEHSIEQMVPLDFIDTWPCFSQQDIFFWGYAEFGIQIFWHFRENCWFCILVQFPFPTILQNSGLQTENFVLFTYILKNKAQTQIFDFSNLYKPLSISSANWMLLLICSVWQPGLSVGYISVTSRSRFAGRVAAAFTESKSIHFHTNLSGASRNHGIIVLGTYCMVLRHQSRLHFTENLHYKFITTLPEGVLRNRNKYI